MAGLPDQVHINQLREALWSGREFGRAVLLPTERRLAAGWPRWSSSDGHKKDDR